ncbi:hypothetical protein A3H85_00165 [Candidatus Daviesbacteria bacterium RIFCSPLOWO2_02_FULL_40_8]|uniref:Uncharacterized protein n=1 Tax=Candidatus Daviesbacteria bacterium RIFCSPLOWO2_01_FULL_40_24 TaxID=1797787 RepID=A0A1F5MJP6_9BACT|nr:MAG: hypothetical protein A2780_01315 [Candidatus Daviesbacteria bacterium RIFCSPHIGHO2_01_FULL_41_45]OGE35500.1 MAG: hypothetical protein A3C32_03565 [Candidatus Daviesbacteria bacterium RIFCSPHIGHO2_02_FULL_41_14]OGE65591.1 MAG: hypothetical protein A3B49_02140 [Candidatus Daviesbacteria bacterium RIFCSPLOWO2_01_FULL_40_24]OGE66522.1 MAG: hypothetical protein A3H85_00165 [Candidatus Daviesbacteria bacterium RIFCSPLOWO2_02_FULL_40_8]
MYNHLLYLGFWFTNSLTIFLSQYIIPGNIVLGNWRFNRLEAAIYAGFWLTFLFWVWWDFAIHRKLKSDNKMISFFVYLVVNSLAIWAVSTFHYVLGFQLLGYLWAFAIGFVMTILQAFAWKIVVRHANYLY